MVVTLAARLLINCRDTIGEGPIWDEPRQRLLWSDNATGLIHEARLVEGEWRENRHWTLNRVLGAAIPRLQEGLLAVGPTDIVIVHETGEVTSFARIDADPGTVRLNDAKCDPQGRLWVGTMAHDFTSRHGALYRVDPDGRISTILKDVIVSNGLDWSPDGSTFYYIDSATRAVDAFDFDAVRGAIHSRRTVVALAPGDGAPDGMTVDSEGCLWVAIFGPGEVRRYAPDGELLTRVKVPVPGVTSCAFGGPDRQDLFITTAALRIPEAILPLIGLTPQKAEEAAALPHAGGLFVCRPGCTGKRATPFGG
jgi:sugar lactone lactonase YvrE